MPQTDKHNWDHGNPGKHPDVPHGHDWGWDSDGNWSPGPAYPWPEDSATINWDTAVKVAGGVVVAYGIYTGIKWVTAGALAVPTGGLSLGIAVVTP